MKHRSIFPLASALVVFVCGVGSAQTTPSKEVRHQTRRNLTGCLEKGDDAKEFRLTDTAGGTWELKSDNVSFAPHLGHTVAITGIVSNAALHGAKEDVKEEAKEHGIDKDATEHGHMTVTALKMVSTHCGK